MSAAELRCCAMRMFISMLCLFLEAHAESAVSEKKQRDVGQVFFFFDLCALLEVGTVPGYRH